MLWPVRALVDEVHAILYIAHDDIFGMPSHPDTTPPIRRPRPVLVLIAFDPVRHVAEELCGSDSICWNVQVDPDELDLRWSDSSGDTFALSNTSYLCYLLSIHRPPSTRYGTSVASQTFYRFQPAVYSASHMSQSTHRWIPAISMLL